MTQNKAAKEEFEVLGNTAVHRPTGARFSRYPNSESTTLMANYKLAGSVLGNGDDYDREDVERVAREILFGQTTK